MRLPVNYYLFPAVLAGDIFVTVDTLQVGGGNAEYWTSHRIIFRRHNIQTNFLIPGQGDWCFRHQTAAGIVANQVILQGAIYKERMRFLLMGDYTWCHLDYSKSSTEHSNKKWIYNLFWHNKSIHTKSSLIHGDLTAHSCLEMNRGGKALERLSSLVDASTLEYYPVNK